MPMRNLEVELTKKLRQASDEAVQLGFNAPNYFLQMLGNYGSVETVHRLLASRKISAGLTNLWELGQRRNQLQKFLGLSMEAIILQEPYCQIFSQEQLEIAKSRMVNLGYAVDL